MSLATEEGVGVGLPGAVAEMARDELTVEGSWKCDQRWGQYTLLYTFIPHHPPPADSTPQNILTDHSTSQVA